MKRAQITMALAALLSTTFIVACGSQKNSTGGSTAMNPNNPAQQKLAPQTKANLKILNAESLKKIAAGSDDNPELYAVQGQLVERATVDQQATPGLVACMTKLTNYEFSNSQQAIAATSTSTVLNRATPVHMIVLEPAQAQNQAPTQQQAQQQQQSFMLNTFQIICLKSGSQITPAEVATALQGIVQIN